MRFRSTIVIDTFGENPEEATKEAMSIIKILNHNYDCNAHMESITPCKFGSIPKNDNPPGHEF